MAGPLRPENRQRGADPVAGRPSRPQDARGLGIQLTSFEEWAQERMRAKT
ncbi:hypothetical protein [Streptomyces sp. NPDC001933]